MRFACPGTWERDTNYTNGHESQKPWVNSCEFVRLVSCEGEEFFRHAGGQVAARDTALGQIGLTQGRFYNAPVCYPPQPAVSAPLL